MEFGNYGYYEDAYDELLTEEEVKRLHELIWMYPVETTTRRIGELLSGRSLREIVELSKYQEAGVSKMKKRSLRQRREKLGYTQREMGAELSLSQPTVGKMESGHFSYDEESYDELLTEKEVERLHELIRIYPAETARYIGELLSGRSDEEDPPNSGLRAV